MGGVIIIIVIAIVSVVGVLIGWYFYQKKLRIAKNYERSLKMVPMMIHLPPPSEDIKSEGRDARDITEETISQSISMYNIIASTATKGFQSKIYGQRHLIFEILVKNGLVHYYVVAPFVLAETVKQAVMSAYPTASINESSDDNIFSETGKIAGVLGGEFSLKREYAYPIATYQDTKKDAMRAILNALSSASKDEGAGIQILIRPAQDGWQELGKKYAKNLREGKKVDAKSSGVAKMTGTMELLWKPPSTENKDPQKQLSQNDQKIMEQIEEKTRYNGYETLVRVVTSSQTVGRSQVLLNNIISAFALFDNPTTNGFKFKMSTNVNQLVQDYIMRIFPQTTRTNILNDVELATIFHLPDQGNIPTSQLERQSFKQVDGPNNIPTNGLYLGKNVFRGVEKNIYLSEADRRRHIYIMGATGMGKSVGVLENIAIQDMLAGRGFAFLDPHGDSAEKLLGLIPRERVEDVIYFNPADTENPIGMNIFEVDPSLDESTRNLQIDTIVSETTGMLHSLYDPNNQGIVGPRMDHIVSNAIRLLMADINNPGTFMDIPKVLVDAEYAKSKIPFVKDQGVLDFWTKEWPNAQRSNDAGEVTSWVVSKWEDFSTIVIKNILGQTHSGLNLFNIMNEGKILIVNLGKGGLTERPAKLLGMMFVMKFQAAAMQRQSIPEDQRRDFSLIVDEFQNFATESFESILSEARKYRLNLIVANQFMSQLIDKIRSAILGNAGSFLIGRVGSEDAEQIVKIFSPTFDVEDLQKLPNFMAFTRLLIDGYPSTPFTMNLPPPSGNPNPELASAIKRLSAAKYGKSRQEVEMEINARLNSAAIQAEQEKKQRIEALRQMSATGQPMTQSATTPIKPMQQTQNITQIPQKSPQNTFLNDWLTKRQAIENQIQTAPAQPQVAHTPEEIQADDAAAINLAK